MTPLIDGMNLVAKEYIACQREHDGVLMLSEFAFTPAIFDEDAQDDKEAWGEQLRELASSIFPRTSGLVLHRQALRCLPA